MAKLNNMNKEKNKLLKGLDSALQNLFLLSLIFRREEMSGSEEFLSYAEEYKRNKKLADECFNNLKKDIDSLIPNGIPLPELFKNSRIKSSKDVASFARKIQESKYESHPEKALILEVILKDDFKEIHDALQKSVFMIENNLPFEGFEKQNVRTCGSFIFNFTTGEIKGNSLNTQFKFKDKKYKLLKLLMNPIGKVRTYKEIAKIYGRSETSDAFEYALRNDIKKIKISLKILPKEKQKNKDIFKCSKGYFIDC